MSRVALLILVAAGTLAGFLVVMRSRPEPEAVAPPPRATPTTHSGTGTGPCEFVILDPDRITRVRLDVTIDGRPIAAVWEDAFARLLWQYDRNGDGVLNRDEAARLPSAFSLRQILWGRSVPYSGHPIPWTELATRGTEQLGVDEVARYYRGMGLGGVSVAYGTSPASAALSKVLLGHLDLDRDGKITEAEWEVARERLKALDRNGDELIRPSELVPHAEYPGSMGMEMLASRGRHISGRAVLMLPTNRSTDELFCVRDHNSDGRLSLDEAGLASDTFTRLDGNGDGSLSPLELSNWRDLPPDHGWKIEMAGNSTPRITTPLMASTHVEIATGTTRFQLRVARGQISLAMAAAQQRLQEQFADSGRSDKVSLADLTKRSQYELQQLVAIADRNDDGRLSSDELEAWLATQELTAKGHALVLIHDHGRGWFEELDADGDGAISFTEIRTGKGRLTRLAGPSRSLFATVSHGSPIASVDSSPRVGPDWFQAMDRNGDGTVTRSEFVGAPEAFDKIDTNRDGTLSPSEAADTRP